MAPSLKIFSERNSGSRYLGKLIELNLQCQELPGVVPKQVEWLQNFLPGDEWLRDAWFLDSFRQNMGWKHRYLLSSEKFPDSVRVIAISKNPYAWLLSLYRNTHHHSGERAPDFETFLQTPWKLTRRDCCGKALENPVELWNIKNASYLGQTGPGVLRISTESLLEDPEAVITRISCSLGIDRKSPVFINHESSTAERGRDTAWYRDYYLNERWRDDLSNSAIDLINERLNRRLAVRLGYRLLLNKPMAPEPEMRIVIGLGSGRCGTMSLAKFLNLQKHSGVTHEKVWEDIKWQGSEMQITNILQQLQDQNHLALSGDVSSSYLPYTEFILSRHPDVKFVCLKRDCAETVSSFMQITATKNHWYDHQGEGWDEAGWDSCFPKYDEPDKQKALTLYWQDYYREAARLQSKYPGSFRVFETNELNGEAGQVKILEFLQIRHRDMRISTGLRENSHADRRRYGFRQAIYALISLTLTPFRKNLG